VCTLYRTVLILVDSVSRYVEVLLLLMLQFSSVLCLPASAQSTIYCVTFILLLLLLLLLLLFSARLAKCNYHVNQIHLLSSSISPTILYSVLAKLFLNHRSSTCSKKSNPYDVIIIQKPRWSSWYGDHAMSRMTTEILFHSQQRQEVFLSSEASSIWGPNSTVFYGHRRNFTGE